MFIFWHWGAIRWGLSWNIVGSAVTLTSFDTVFNILLLSDSTLKMNMGDVICTFRKSGNLDVTDAKRFLTVGYWNCLLVLKQIIKMNCQ